MSKKLVLCDVNSFGKEVMRVSDRELARKMARRDADVMLGCDVLVREFETHRTWRPKEPVVGHVYAVELEEHDDYIDMVVKFKFDTWVCGELQGAAYGRTYDMSGA